MDFGLNEEQKLVQATVRQMAQEQVRPKAAATDKNHAIPPETLTQLAELGLWGSYIPEEDGGSGLDYLSYILSVEALSAACASTGVLLAAHASLGCDPIHRSGTKEQKAKWLAPLCKGEKIGCFLLTEPGAGSDVASLKTRYLEQDDHYELTGSKQFITNGGYLGTGVVFATSDPSLGHKGISAFILDLKSPGVTLLKNEEKMGIRGSFTSAFALDQVKIPKDQLLGAPHQGFAIAMETLDGGRISISAQALGIAQEALDLALNYSTERQQFGKPIGQFQAIRFKLADMAAALESARLMTYKAAWLKNQHQESAQVSAMAKLLASKAAQFCTDEALQIHGGYGYSAEYPLERLYRDAKITEIYEGTSEIQRIVIAKGLEKG